MNDKESIKLVPSTLNILSKIKPVEAPSFTVRKRNSKNRGSKHQNGPYALD